MKVYEGVRVFDEPLDQNIYDFLFSHLGCNCIFERIDSNMNNPIVRIYAYAEKPIYNYNLREYFKYKGYGDPIRIKQGLDKSEVNAID